MMGCRSTRSSVTGSVRISVIRALSISSSKASNGRSWSLMLPGRSRSRFFDMRDRAVLSDPRSSVRFMADGSLAAGVAMLRAAIDLLLEADVAGVPGKELAGQIAEIEVQRCRLGAVDQVVITQLDECQLAGEVGRQSTADLRGELLRLSPGEATARVHAAHDMGPRRELCGAPEPPARRAGGAVPRRAGGASGSAAARHRRAAAAGHRRSGRGGAA